jgi:dolichyl-phosphate-mannose-protein mannosyltransferase
VTPQAEAQQIIGREETIEYRDQHGNLLDEAQVAALVAEGKASFETKYETKTKLVDADGNEVVEPASIAPPHPDIEGQNPDTKGLPESKANSEPPEAVISAEGDNKEKDGKAKPASEASEATK